MNKKFYIIALFLLIGTFQLSAQTKKTESVDFVERLWYGVNVGGIGISSNSFSAGIAPMGGIKLNDYIALGAIAKLNYLYTWRLGGETGHFFDYGGGLLGRVKLFKGKYFAQVEYDRMSLNTYDGLNQRYTRTTYPFLYFGGGMIYPSGGKWSSELVVLYNVLSESADVIFPLSFSYAFVYNF